MSSSLSFAPLVARSRRRSGRMLAWSSVGLACMLVVESAGRTTTVFDYGRIADLCIVEDRVDRCSSYIRYSVKNF